jgi:hypothetical protein
VWAGWHQDAGGCRACTHPRDAPCHKMGHRRGAWCRRPPRTSENDPAPPHAAARNLQSTGSRLHTETVSRHYSAQRICFRHSRRRYRRLASDGSGGRLRPMTKRIKQVLSVPIKSAMTAAQTGPPSSVFGATPVERKIAVNSAE